MTENRAHMDSDDKIKCRILVVDDDIQVLNFISVTLSSAGYAGQYVKDAETALALITEFDFDVVVLDLCMPGMDGLEFLNKLLEMKMDIIPIVLTGAGDVRNAVSAIKLGAYDFLEKPVHREIIIKAVERARASKENQDRLRKARLINEELEILLDAFPDIIIAADTHFNILRCNKTLTDLIHLDESWLVGKHIHEILCDPDAHGIDACPFLPAVSASEHFVSEHLFLDRLFDFDIRALRDKSNQHSGWLFHGRDTTDLRKAQKELNESQHRLAAILDSVITGVVIIDENTGEIIGVNPYALNIIGRPKHKIIGKKCQGFLCPTERGQCPALNFGGRIDHAERVVLNSLGEKIPVLKNVTRTTINGKRLLIETFLDISELKRVEETKRVSEEKFRRIVENIGMGIALIGTDMRVLEMNSQMKAWYPHVNPGDCPICYETFKDPPGEHCCKGCPTEQCLKDGLVHGATMEIVYKENVRKLRIVASPLTDSDGNIVAAIEMVEDITRQYQVEQQLQQAQKLESIGQLAAGIAHEINTPMQFISDNTHFLENAFADLLKVLKHYDALTEQLKNGGVDPERLRALEAVVQESDLDFLEEEIPGAIGGSIEGIARVTKIVRAMKDFSHPAGNELVPVDINKAIDSTIAVSRNEWKYVANMETQLDPDQPLVPCYPGPLNQVLLNIIVNAAHAVGEKLGPSPVEKGVIRISTRSQGKWFEIRIQDSGVGVPKSHLSKIFDPFFTTKSVGKGTGQGLSIAYSVIVDQHKGELKVESEMGEGATFVIRLPIVGASS